MVGFEESSQDLNGKLPLPPGFQTVESILSLPNEQLRKKPQVNVIGIVRDYQPPIATKGTDYKCAITIVDVSTQYDKGIKVNMFWKHDEMPHISDVGDVVLLRAFKAQDYFGLSLLGNYGSDITVFHAASIPSWPCLIPSELPRSSSTRKGKRLSTAELTYVTWIPNALDKTSLPPPQEFQERMEQAMVKKEKYSALKDVKNENFYDLIGEVVRKYEQDGRGTVYISDYTAHSLFYNNVWGGNNATTSRDGDEYGYVRSKSKAAKDWPGPYGKLTMQLTIYEPHINFIMEHVEVGTWVMLQNVYVKMGNMGGCLEGFLRGDRNQPDRLLVQILTQPEDPEEKDLVDPRWKEAIRRKQQYLVKFNASKKRFLQDAEELTGNRKSDAKQSEKLNSKKRRKLERAAVLQKVVESEQKKTAEYIDLLDLNINIRSNHMDKPAISLDDIVKGSTALMSGNEQQYSLPFVNTNFRAYVRVVDYFPHRLQEFSVGRRVTEYDILSDASDGESTDLEEDMRQFRAGKGFGGEKKWEWRFALQVEQAGKDPRDLPRKIWLVVDNPSAQRLLGQDAVNLRQDEAALSSLREQIFTLWGDLEEKKSAFLDTPEGKALLCGQPATPEREEVPEPISHKTMEDLPPDSDDENMTRDPMINGRISKPQALTERDPNAGSRSSPSEEKKSINSAVLALPVLNKGFTCCIKQYGIKLPEEDDSKADAGEGFRWARIFGLFGTMIATPDEDD